MHIKEYVKEVRMNKIDFAAVQDELHKLGHITNIEKVGTKQYNVIVNFEIVRTYKTRISCKRRIIKLSDNLKQTGNES